MKERIAKLNGIVKSGLAKSKKIQMALMLGVVGLMLQGQAHADLITIDGTSGMPVFDASVVYTPVITALCAVVTAAAALWVAIGGVGYIKKYLGR